MPHAPNTRPHLAMRPEREVLLTTVCPHDGQGIGLHSLTLT